MPDKTDAQLIADFGLDDLTQSALDGNPLLRERLQDVYDEISLTRGICSIGTECEDEEIENNFGYSLD
jgi:hypothetical protein|tara:strand:- start:1199 stop:1402 length:204 start_codon:yes stop_codon:yes gene_type:complete